MRRLLVAAAGAIGFVAVFLATVVGRLWMNQDADCDGVCTDMFGIVGELAVVLRGLGPLGGGRAAAALSDRRRVLP